jgi:hypothetical protein
MKKTNVTLTSQTIITLETGTHEAVRDGGNLYVLIQQEDDYPEDSEETPEPKKAKKPKKAEKAKEVEEEVDEEVADDTAPKKKSAKATKAKKKSPAKKEVKEEVSEEAEEQPKGAGEEIPESEWSTLEKGEVVQAQLVLEDDDPDNGKLWLAKVADFKKPKGGDEKALFITFDEDGETDFLREGDRLFRHKVAL